MRKIFFLFLMVNFICGTTLAQDEENEERKGFQKEKLFTGGSLSLSFFNQSLRSF